MNTSFLDARILVLDDEPANLRLVEKILHSQGYTNFQTLSNPTAFFAAFDNLAPDLILLDLMMPEMSGFEVMDRLKPLIPADSFLPVLILTADASVRTKQTALASLATDLLTKPFDYMEAVLRIRNLLCTRRLHLEQARQQAELDRTVRERTVALRSALADLQQSQQQVIQQERMHALAVMASGVAHDFNNALSVILGFGELVLSDCERFPDRAKDAEALRAIVTAAHDAARMVTRLREFHRPPDSDGHEEIDLNALLRQAASLTEPRWRTQCIAKGIAIHCSVEPKNIPPIWGDAAELREALTNLIFNAVDAMPAGGLITLRTRAEADCIVLEVADTGTGMSEEVRQRCLEPFFTTKGDKGTGLGLAMVYGIINRHGGRLEIESERNRGTTFVLRFPVSSGVRAVESLEAIVTGRALRILVVDDQEVFRDIMRQFLEEDGHQVATACDGQAGLEKFNGRRFDLVITNQSMPRMAGHQFIAEIKRLRPTVPVIMLTGFGAGGEAGKVGAPDLVLGKPISRRALRQAIADLAPVYQRESMREAGAMSGASNSRLAPASSTTFAL